MYLSKKGFTLVELLFGLAIVMLLIGLAAPTFQSIIQEQQVRSAVISLASSLQLARVESIKRNRPVLVDNENGDWSSGWIVYVDLNRDGRPDPGEPVIQREPPLAAQVVVNSNRPIRRYVRYTANGRTKMNSGAFQAGTFWVCHLSGNVSRRKIIISASGRARRDVEPAGPCSITP
ncbi:GspH/FimT family pseudopilin [Metapseudomonas boanensis]|uniref:Type II secretion system protein H n=1 Tax=Metapseudomonas boanensis TaxID=2822138 RepID=A0ABS5XMU3_9GAMM|nr:GspH/FimT family pseudopilin [Pseudomonas boanensis]MBT8769000.1 GspH/FimT family pseudopilin [Pseudomonas boanensis]